MRLLLGLLRRDAGAVRIDGAERGAGWRPSATREVRAVISLAHQPSPHHPPGGVMTTPDPTFYVDENRKLWNAWTGLHEKSRFYNLAGVRAGGLSLRPIELEELAPAVAGRSMLHLMCHFGLDTLSWARLGAEATGVDLANDAITTARRIGQELGIQARFIESDIYRLPDILSDQFDIVFSSYGVLHWLPDLQQWAETIAHFLRPGGFFYLVEDHPFMRVFSTDATDRLDVANPYFFDNAPTRRESPRSYASDAELAEAMPSNRFVRQSS